jgi:hypothetical protein
MLLVLPVVVPFVLLFVLLAMERVERPLRRYEHAADLETFLLTAQPDEVERYVRDGYQPALDGYWSRRKRRPATD